jgi:hypothetical protein
MKQLFVTMFAIWLTGGSIQAQNDNASRITSIPLDQADTTKAWIFGGGLAADLGNILIINPKPGSGQNRLGFGGAIGLFGNHRKDRFSWDNNISLNLALEKTGSGILPIPGRSIRIPFRKSIDDLRANSTAGYQVSENSKFSYAADLAFRSQFIPAYLGVEDGQVYAKSIMVPGPYQNTLVSQIFSPARIAFGIGIKYDPDTQLSIFFSPLTADVIIIENQYIANLGIHGTQLKEGSTSEYENIRWALGARLGVKYNQKFLNEKLVWGSRLALFSDYMSNPQNVDVDWTNELALEIVRNLQLAWLSNLYYDDDIRSNVTDFYAPGGLKVDADGNPILRTAVNYYHQIVLRYTRVF